MSYVVTYTGRIVDLANPSPEQIHIDDISHALSQVNRYTGHTRVPYSVGYHTLLCHLEAVRRGESNRILLLLLMHDFSEYVLNDLSRPLKDLLPEYMVLEDNMMTTIYEAFNVSPPTVDELTVVKFYDNKLLSNEIGHYMASPELYSIKVNNDVFFIDNISPKVVAKELKDAFLRTLEIYHKEKEVV